MAEIIEQIGDKHGITVRYDVYEARVDFFAAEVTGVGVDPDPGVKYYWRKGAESSEDNTTDFNDAERYIDGTVKVGWLFALQLW